MPKLSRSNAIEKQWIYYKSKLLQQWGLDILNEPQMSHFHRPNADIPINILGRLSGLASTFPHSGVWVVNEIVRTKSREGPIKIEELKAICENLKALDRTTLPIGNFSAPTSSPGQTGPSLLHPDVNLAAPSSSPYDQPPTSKGSISAAISRDEVTTVNQALLSSSPKSTSSALFDPSAAVRTPVTPATRDPADYSSTNRHPSLPALCSVTNDSLR